jgi:hypothetical protein
VTTPGARDLLLDRREGEVIRRDAEYGARSAARKKVLKRWQAEEDRRQEEFARLMRGEVSADELKEIKARRAAEDAARDGELAIWTLENEAVGARMRREDAGFAAAVANAQGEGGLYVVR